MIMGWQTLSDFEEMLRFDDKARFGHNLPRYLQKRAGKTECLTAEQWLDRYTGWCEPFKARISPDACKSRKGSELSDFCKGCTGIRNRSGKLASSTGLSERTLP
jgi:hypothetical protein